MDFKARYCETPDYEAVWRLYNSAFPPDERRQFPAPDDFRLFAEEKNKEGFRIMVFEKDGEFAGFLSFWHFGEEAYVEHFAIEEAMRGQGIGGDALDEFVKMAGSPVILEVEIPETPEAKRRIVFYQRHGFRTEEDFPYIQPPYSPEQSSLPMLLMTHGYGRKALEESVGRIYRHVYGCN